MKINRNFLIAASAIAILGSGATLLMGGCPFKNKGAANNQITEVNQPLKVAKVVSASLLFAGVAVGGTVSFRSWQKKRQAAIYQELEFPNNLPQNLQSKDEDLANISQTKK